MDGEKSPVQENVYLQAKQEVSEKTAEDIMMKIIDLEEDNIKLEGRKYNDNQIAKEIKSIIWRNI